MSFIDFYSLNINVLQKSQNFSNEKSIKDLNREMLISINCLHGVGYYPILFTSDFMYVVRNCTFDQTSVNSENWFLFSNLWSNK